MKRLFFLLFLCVASAAGSHAQRANTTYSYYGFVRGDLYTNTRQNTESVDGLFYLYPKDRASDADGKDMNHIANGSFYTFTTRLGMDIAGPDAGTAKTSAKIETDFGGTTDMNFMLRVRQAYVKFAWENSTLLLGQTWHPLFGEVVPTVLNLSTGSPFQPFNRSPQINYQRKAGNVKLTASALYQLIYTSTGQDGKGEKYQKNSALPELYIGADYKNKSLLVGAGADLLTLRPRTQSTVEGNTYRVDEHITSLSYDLHARYQTGNIQVAGKTLLASNLTHNVMLGGYGVTAIDSRTGEQQYTPFRHSTTWLNVVCGSKWQCLLFAGYTKNLGTSVPLADDGKRIYGTGVNIDRLLRLSIGGRYTLPHWSIGIEYLFSNAAYGVNDATDGKVRHSHNAENHRVETTFIYSF